MDDLLKIRDEITAYQQLTQDKAFASRVENGKVQLVRVTYDDLGNSTVEECSEWLSVADFLKHMEEISL